MTITNKNEEAKTNVDGRDRKLGGFITNPKITGDEIGSEKCAKIREQ